jgi:TolB-like protein
MSIFAELNRRNVLRVGAAYAALSWLVIQIAETVFPLFGFDETPARIVVIVLAIGLVPALIFSWAFEWTPEGLVRDSEADRSMPTARLTARRLDRTIMLVLALALAYFAFDKFVLDVRRETAEQRLADERVEEAREAGRAEAMIESYGERSIAVLPFSDMSPDGDQEYLSDGVAEELLNVLAEVPELRVISRTSSFAFKGQALRITAQLIEGRSDTHVWSENFDRNLEDVFAIQDEIAAAVADALHAVLVDPRTQTPSPQLTEAELEAYQLVLRGRYLMNQQTADTYGRAAPFFEQAIELDPDNAAAHGALALTLKQWFDRGAAEDPQQTIVRIEAALERAFELDPDNLDALVAKGKMLWGPAVERARRYWLRATELNPSEPDAWRYLAWSYRETDAARFLELLQKAYMVDPTRRLTNYQYVLTLSDFGRLDDALKVARDYHVMDPDSVDPVLWYADVYFFYGQRDEALRGLYSVFRADVEPWKSSAIPWVMLNLDLPELAETWARYLLDDNPPSAAPLAIALAVQGKTEQALQVLDADRDRPGSQSARVRGEVHAQFTGDFDRALVELESGLTMPGEDEPQIHATGMMEWFAWANYTWMLRETGQHARADRYVSELLDMLLEQRRVGVVLRGSMSMDFLMALFYAQHGDENQALARLQQAINSDVGICPGCLRDFHHFDALRGDPNFEALAEQVYAEVAAQRQRLADEGLLLTPEEVLRLEDYSFDPFAD